VANQQAAIDLPSDMLTEDERGLLRSAIAERGFPAMVACTGASREALARAVSGLGTRKGTIALIRRALVGAT
jgi:hypothetical protein